MLTKPLCSECGSALPGDLPGLPCPVCSLRAALSLGKVVRAKSAAEDWDPKEIGPYRVREKLGEGACGIVYLAEQTQPFQRQVALKIIKPGMDTRQLIARFELERQALALMDHPNIARVLDAGAADSGRPFFVMELVHGPRITDFCDENALSVRERLELFVQVCRGVQHAHQKGILHRDLKPSNVLVSMRDGRAVPKVIDFGVAKALQSALAHETSLTTGQQFLGTPAYMSPEQAGLNPADLDTRSDIYSLGALLYELLSGRVPFDKGDLGAGGIDQLLRSIREVDPLAPSLKASRLAGAEAEPVARRRGADRHTLIKQLRGDLDAIVLKCLEKDPARRYATASDLAADLERHLNNEVINAAVPSTFSKLRKFARRNYAPLSAAAVLVLLLGAGIVATADQALRATRAEREERRLRREAEAREHLLERSVAEAEAQKQRAENAVVQIERQKRGKELALQDSQQQRTNALLALERTQTAQGETERALDLAGKATLRAEAALCESRERQDSLEAAMNFMLFDLSARLEPIGKVDLLRSVTERVLAHYQSGPEAAPMGIGLVHRFAALKNLAHVQMLQGDSSGAFATYQSCLDLARGFAANDPAAAHWQIELAACQTALGNLLACQGRFSEAVVEFGRSREIGRHMAATAPANLDAAAQLQACDAGMSEALWALGEKTEAIDTCRKALNACVALAAANPESSQWKLELCSGYARLGSCLLEQSDITGARKAGQSAFQLARELARIAPADRAVQMQFARTHDHVGDVLLADRQSSEALIHYKEALRIRLETAQADPDNAEWQRELTRSYLRIGRARAGEDKSSKLTGLFQESLQAMGRVHRKHLQFAQELLSAGRPDARSIEAMRENVARARELADKDPANLEWQDDLARNYSLAGDVLFESGDKAAAFDDYREAVKIRADLADRAGVTAISFQVDLATERARFAARLEHTGDHKAAFAQARLALDVLRPLLSRWPGSLAFLQMDGPGNGMMLVAINPQQRADFVEAFKRGFDEAQRHAAKDRPDWANYCSEMAALDFVQADIRNAVTHASGSVAACRQIQRENPDLPEAQDRLSTELLSLGFLQLLDHQIPEAMQTAQAILDNRRDSLGANGLLALGHLLRGEVDETQRILLELKDVEVAPGKSFAEALFADYARLRGKGFPIANPQIVDVVFVRNF